MDTNKTDVSDQHSDDKSTETTNEGHKNDPHHPAFPKQVVEEPGIQKPEIDKPPIEVPDFDKDGAGDKSDVITADSSDNNGDDVAE